MIRSVIWLLIWLLVGVAVALVFRDDNGYLLIRFGPYIVETSLVFFVFALAAVIVAVYGLWRLLVAGWRLPRNLRRRRRQRRQAQAQRSLARGLINFWEGRWRQSEIELMRRIAHSPAPAAHYLPAARAAQQQGATDRRDQYLKRAYQGDSGSELAALLTQAELQMAEGQHAQALATLSRVREVAPGEPQGLRLCVELYRALKDWRQLGDLLPELERQKVYPKSEREALAERVHEHLLISASAGGRQPLLETWESIPRDLRHGPRLLRRYCRELARHGSDQEAADLVTSRLRKTWDPELALLFSRLKSEDPVSQLSAAEGWLKRYGEKPELLLVAGRLCLRNRLWGRSRNYLESSIRAQPRAEAYFELGRLFQETNDARAAQDAFRRGLELALAGEGAPAGTPQPAALEAPPPPLTVIAPAGSKNTVG